MFLQHAYIDKKYLQAARNEHKVQEQQQKKGKAKPNADMLSTVINADQEIPNVLNPMHVHQLEGLLQMPVRT